MYVCNIQYHPTSIIPTIVFSRARYSLYTELIGSPAPHIMLELQGYSMVFSPMRRRYRGALWHKYGVFWPGAILVCILLRAVIHVLSGGAGNATSRFYNLMLAFVDQLSNMYVEEAFAPINHWPIKQWPLVSDMSWFPITYSLLLSYSGTTCNHMQILILLHLGTYIDN